jgi:dTDP-4-dehydrorhamnose 3,5-epimerase-like enzyme
MEEPAIIEGGLHIDDRGVLAFLNKFPDAGIKRFYIVSNHKQNFVRAWHAHRHEEKYLFALEGTFLIGAVRIDEWENPSKDLEIKRFTVSSEQPKLLKIPKGYANGTMNLTARNKLLIFSTSTLEESMKDDIRYDADRWENVWSVIPR